MRYGLCCILLLFVMMIPFRASSSVNAQGNSDPELQCDTDALDGLVNTWSETLIEIKDTSDAQGKYDSLVALRNEMSSLEALCQGLSFEGNSEKVFGPMIIPEGIYRLSAKTDGFFTLDFEILDGDCEGPESYTQNIFALFQSDTPGRVSEAVFKSSGCDVLWETSNITQDYSVNLEKLK